VGLYKQPISERFLLKLATCAGSKEAVESWGGLAEQVDIDPGVSYERTWTHVCAAAHMGLMLQSKGSYVEEARILYDALYADLLDQELVTNETYHRIAGAFSSVEKAKFAVQIAGVLASGVFIEEFGIEDYLTLPSYGAERERYKELIDEYVVPFARVY
jgi:hypothetical protein